MVPAELCRGDQRGNGLCGRQLHLIVDVAGPYIEGAAEDAREGQNIVDLVGEIAAAGTDDRSARLPGPRQA